MKPYCLWEGSFSMSQFIDYITEGDTSLFQQTYECYQGETDDPAAGDVIHEYVKKELP